MELNQSKQNFRCVGIVNEIDMTREDCKIKTQNEEVDGERIKGNIAIRMANGIKTFNVFVNSITSKGDESKQWKNALAMLELNPEIGGTGEASVVSVSGRVDENSYLGQDNNVHTALRWSATRVSTRVNEEDAHACTLSGNFFIKNIRPEVKDDEETGRLLVTLCGVNYNAEPILIETIVKEDLAEDFADIYEAGQTANFDIDVVMEHIGEKNTGRKKFGSGGSVNVNSGYDKETLVIVGGDEPIEEPDDPEIDNGWIDPKVMKAALKERDVKLQEIKNGDNKSKSTKASAKTTLKDKKLGRKTPTKVEPEDENEDPFDEDDDF